MSAHIAATSSQASPAPSSLTDFFRSSSASPPKRTRLRKLSHISQATPARLAQHVKALLAALDNPRAYIYDWLAIEHPPEDLSGREEFTELWSDGLRILMLGHCACRVPGGSIRPNRPQSLYAEICDATDISGRQPDDPSIAHAVGLVSAMQAILVLALNATLVPVMVETMLEEMLAKLTHGNAGRMAQTLQSALNDESVLLAYDFCGNQDYHMFNGTSVVQSSPDGANDPQRKGKILACRPPEVHDPYLHPEQTLWLVQWDRDQITQTHNLKPGLVNNPPMLVSGQRIPELIMFKHLLDIHRAKTLESVAQGHQQQGSHAD